MNTTDVKINYPEESTLVLLADIDKEDRGREDYGDLEELSNSLLDLGIIHPPTLSRNGNKLIAGGRRIAAMQLLGMTMIPCLYREDMPDHLITEMELEENLRRKGMKWQEQVLLLTKVHDQKVKANVKLQKHWRQSDTGRLLKCSTGHVSHALVIGKLILSGDQEITEADSLVAAWNVILARREQEAMAETATRSGAVQVATQPTPNQPLIVDLDTESTTIINPDPNTAGAIGESVTATAPAQSAQKFEVDLSSMFMQGDCIELMNKMPEACVDHVITDIPYGIDMDNLDKFTDVDKVAHTHDVKENVSMMPKFLEAAFRVVKENGFCVFWYDLAHHEKLLEWAGDAGWSAQRWPIVWVKTHPCRNSAADKNFTKATEYAMVLRKSKKTSMIKPANKNYVLADGAPERKLYNNPFAKPFEVWKFILSHVAFKGQTVLDPYAGQMSCPRACINMGIVPRAMELDPYHFFHGVNMIKELYGEMTQGNTTFHNDPIAKMDPSMFTTKGTNE